MNNKRSQMMGIAVAAMGLLGLMPSVSADVVVISDTFTLNGTDRTVGAPLAGTVTEVGNRTWSLTGAETLSPTFATGGTVVGTPGFADNVLVSLSGISSAYTSVQADINPSGGAWAALVFNDNAGSMWYGSLMIILDNSGGYTLFKGNYAGTVVATGTAPTFTPNALNQVQMAYYAPSNSVSAWINGVNIVNAVSLGAYTPVLNYAGLAFYDGTGKEVDNFQVAIPEPVTASLLLLGLGGLLARRRNRA